MFDLQTIKDNFVNSYKKLECLQISIFLRFDTIPRLKKTYRG